MAACLGHVRSIIKYLPDRERLRILAALSAAASHLPLPMRTGQGAQVAIGGQHQEA